MDASRPHTCVSRRVRGGRNGSLRTRRVQKAWNDKEGV
jgi:hypothetical protein